MCTTPTTLTHSLCASCHASSNAVSNLANITPRSFTNTPTSGTSEHRSLSKMRWPMASCFQPLPKTSYRSTLLNSSTRQHGDTYDPSVQSQQPTTRSQTSQALSLTSSLLPQALMIHITTSRIALTLCGLFLCTNTSRFGGVVTQSANSWHGVIRRQAAEYQHHHHS
jgi:hypothetical protein